MTTDSVADTPFSTRDLQDLEARITELAAHLSAVTYRLLVMLGEFDARRGRGGAGLKSCAQWHNWKCGIALGAAGEKVRVAHALPELRKTVVPAWGGERMDYSMAVEALIRRE